MLGLISRVAFLREQLCQSMRVPSGTWGAYDGRIALDVSAKLNATQVSQVSERLALTIAENANPLSTFLALQVPLASLIMWVSKPCQCIIIWSLLSNACQIFMCMLMNMA